MDKHWLKTLSWFVAVTKERKEWGNKENKRKLQKSYDCNAFLFEEVILNE